MGGPQSASELADPASAGRSLGPRAAPKPSAASLAPRAPPNPPAVSLDPSALPESSESGCDEEHPEATSRRSRENGQIRAPPEVTESSLSPRRRQLRPPNPPHEHPAPTNARIAYVAITWFLGPATVALFWIRMLALRSSIAAWFTGNHLPAASAVGMVLIVYSIINAMWFSLRQVLNSGTPRVAAAESLEFRLHPAALALVAVATLPVVTVPLWIDHWRPVTLRLATLSEKGGPNSKIAIGAILPGANLRRADLQGAVLDGVDLSGAVLDEAQLGGASLIGATLSNASLRHASILRANLDDVQANGIDLTGASIEASTLRHFQSGMCELEGAGIVESDLSSASLTSCRAAGIAIIGSRLNNAKLSSTELYGATLSWNQMRGVSFSVGPLLDVEKYPSHLECVDFRAGPTTRRIVWRASRRSIS